MPWKHNTWIDDDGSLTVGTEFDAEHMNNVELGIAEGLGGVAAASGMAGSALTLAGSANTVAKLADTKASAAKEIAESTEQTAGSALVTGQQANKLAASGVTAAGSALVTGQQARVAVDPALAEARTRGNVILARVATTKSLPANTLTGNLLEATANGVLPAQDGVSLVVGDRLFNWAEGETEPSEGISSAKHGVFEVVSLGSASTKWKLTRISSMNESSKVSTGMQIALAQGAKYGGVTFKLLTTGTIVLNTTALTFSYTSTLRVPELLNAWTVYTAGPEFAHPRFRKSFDGRVSMKGLVSNTKVFKSAESSKILQLPEGWWPTEREIFNPVGNIGASNAAIQRIDVLANGEVIYFAEAEGAVAFLPLTSVSFYPN